ncbi:MAG: DUF4474 domain-containing protein [Oscillospiraceae bacterium]|jgi:hypothetical protein|nr:DUF4474 domain-containing protein [Oscillospiraceae bacterium]
MKIKRAFLILLALLLLLTAGTVPVSAKTAAEVNNWAAFWDIFNPDVDLEPLKSNYRSLKNPRGTFSLPEPNATWETMNPATAWAAAQLISQFVARIATNEGSGQLNREIMSYCPIATPAELAKLPVSKYNSEEVIWAMLTGGHNGFMFFSAKPGEKDVYLIYLAMTDLFGKQTVTPMNLQYSVKTGFLEGSRGTGVIYNTHDLDLDDFGWINPNDTPLVLDAGYSWLYDFGSGLISNIDEILFPFEYNGTEYLIEMWKGEYIEIIHGSEIAIYTKSKDPLLAAFGQYDCGVNNRLMMSSTTYIDGKVWYKTDPVRKWWLGRGRLHDLSKNWEPEEMRLDGTILFEEKGMLDAFVASVKENAPDKSIFTWSVKGLLFSFKWLNTK